MFVDPGVPLASPDMPVRVDTAEVDDAVAIARVHVVTWQRAYEGIIPADYLNSLSVTQREPIWRQILSSAKSRVLVARKSGEVVGFVVFGRSRDQDATPEVGEIHALYVLPCWWSHGIGQALWLSARDHLQQQSFKKVSLWVLADNVRAQRFYSGAGFRIDAGHLQQIERGGRQLTEIRYVLPSVR